MSKSIVSILIGIAIDEGYIESVDQKIIDFIPEFKREGENYNQDVTIKHLLTMSSGMNWQEATTIHLALRPNLTFPNN